MNRQKFLQSQNSKSISTRFEKILSFEFNAKSFKWTRSCNCIYIKGVVTGKQAKQMNVGGEVLCLRILKKRKMSRIGNAPITVPEGVEISQADGMVTVKGKKGELSQEMDECYDEG